MCAVPSGPGGPAAGSGTLCHGDGATAAGGRSWYLSSPTCSRTCRGGSAAALGVDLVVPALHHGPIMSLGDIRNLDYTILLCSKMQETKDFYRDVMGFPLAHDSERWVSFQVGSALLTLRPH